MALRGPFPNPFASGARLEFDLPHAGATELRVFDVTGREVRRLIRGDLDAGRHLATWDGKDARGVRVASGVYWFRLESQGTTRETRALVLR
jgi:flagellar hook assembly protein FlgD